MAEAGGGTVAEVRRVLAAHGFAGRDLAKPSAGPLLVALSGGRDSLVLLHILRFHVAPPSGIVAVHVDHGMRPGSEVDGRWLAGLCRAWEVPLQVVRLDPAPRSEAEARTLRYQVLRDEARACGSRLVLVAHHAEDQAETILFRILRGTGPRGLAGIPPTRVLDRCAPSIHLLRPLLRVAGDQVEEWARVADLRPREDPTNRELRFRRNRIRHHLLPGLETGSPGFRDDLLALGDAARGRERALERILRAAAGELGVVRERNRISFARKRFLRYPEAVRAELLRRFAREGGGSLGRRGLALALRFSATAASGREVTVGAGVRLVRDFDTLVLDLSRFGQGPASAVPSPPVYLEAPGGEVHFAPGPGGLVRVWWAVGDGGKNRGEAPSAPGRAECRATFPAALIEAPLELRSRRPGDRVRLHLGPGPEGGPPRLRRLKKLLGEARVSRETRDRLPLLVDARGWVIWIPGVWRTQVPTSGTDPRTWTIGVMDASNFA